MDTLKTKTLEGNERLQAMLEAFKGAQLSNTFEGLEIQGSDMETVKILSDAFEEYVVHGSEE